MADIYAEIAAKAKMRNMKWYHDNLKNVLQQAKEKHGRDIDVSIELADQLMKALDEPVEKAVEYPIRKLVQSDVIDVMRPVEPEVLDLIYKSTTKGAAERYLKERNKKAPDDKYYNRITTSFDYGWQLQESRLAARDVNRGRCGILRDTFYRKNNVAPDSVRLSQPTGASVSICSEYQCSLIINFIINNCLP